MDNPEQNDTKSAITFLHRKVIELEMKIASLEHERWEDKSIQKKMLAFLGEDVIFDRNGTPLHIGDTISIENVLFNEDEMYREWIIDSIGVGMIYFMDGTGMRRDDADEMILLKKGKHYQ